jgi:Domain of unknown function (DUF4410)
MTGPHPGGRLLPAWGRSALCLCLLLVLSACAGSVAPPTVVLGPPQGQQIFLRDVVAEAAPGVAMTPEDLKRNVQLVLAEIRASSPAVLQPSGEPHAWLMKIIFTRYDEGNAFARFMLAGLGQIRIEADVLLLDPDTGQTVAKYQVAKDFSFGGIYGGTTTIQDVEKGFARSVAATVKQKT